MPDSASVTEGALDGLRVLDLTQVMAGPYCTMLLADLGADVVKIENPEDGDQTRRSWGYAVHGEDSRAFLALNRNKRSVCLDLKSAEGLADFHRLVLTADVRGMVQEIDHPIEGRVRVLGSPVRMSGTPARLRRHPPLLGEHTTEVLAEQVP
jgi:crotonobetainyl-CoA:carnitine CoA-transferase CaiB-like acyl-CoA transferase